MKVRCKELDLIFDSTTVAGHFVGRTRTGVFGIDDNQILTDNAARQKINRAIKNGTPCGGFHWEWYEGERESVRKGAARYIERHPDFKEEVIQNCLKRLQEGGEIDDGVQIQKRRYG